MDKPLQVYPGRDIRSVQTTSTPQPHHIASEQLQQPHTCPDGQECSGMGIQAERDQEKDPFDHRPQLEQQRSLPVLHHNENNDNDNTDNNDIDQGEEDEEEKREEEGEETTSTPFQAPSSDISRIWSASTSSSTTVVHSNEARGTLDVAARASSIGTRTGTRTRTRTRATRRVVAPESGVLSSLLFPSSPSTLEEQGWDSNKLDTEVATGSVLHPGMSLAIVTSFKEGQTEDDMSTTGTTTTRTYHTHSQTHPSTSEETHLAHEHASSSAHGSLSALQMQFMASPTRASTATPSTPTIMTMTPTSSSPSFSSSSSSPFFSSTTATSPTSSTSPSEPKDTTTPLVDQDCAICLDSILPKKHAKATLACRHEFHLSCIS